MAVVLLIGFYLFAGAVAVVLAALPILEYLYLERVHAQIAIACFASAGAIASALVPRRDRFEAPGPELHAEQEPRFFEFLREVASKTGEAMPRRIYLIPDVNAWVAQRGGRFGFGGERVMGIGLPLLAALDVEALRGVIAHEFGHFSGGDTRLGPLLYTTRAAIDRTLSGLARNPSWLSAPFRWYGNFFLRVTHGVSRAQELAADSLAADVAGGPALARALRSLRALSALFDGYWRGEVVPLLREGFRPPLAEGFTRYLASPGSPERFAEIAAAALEEASDPYDTHPPLGERLANLGESRSERISRLREESGAAAPSASAAGALGLLSGLDGLERALLTGIAGPRGDAPDLQMLSWEESGERVLRRSWRRVVSRRAQGLRGLDLSGLADAAHALPQTELLLSSPEERVQRSDEERWNAAVGQLSAALSEALACAGFAVESLPGQPVRLLRGGEAIEPWSVIAGLASGELEPGAWRARCAELGIAELALVPAELAAEVAPPSASAEVADEPANPVEPAEAGFRVARWRLFVDYNFHNQALLGFVLLIVGGAAALSAEGTNPFPWLLALAGLGLIVYGAYKLRKLVLALRVWIEHATRVPGVVVENAASFVRAGVIRVEYRVRGRAHEVRAPARSTRATQRLRPGTPVSVLVANLEKPEIAFVLELVAKPVRRAR